MPLAALGPANGISCSVTRDRGAFRRAMSRMAEIYYDRCPKCEHAPLPAEQALPAACPACGIVLAKVAAAERQHKQPTEPIEYVDEQPRFFARLLALATNVPEQVNSAALIARAILLLGFAVWGVKLIALDFRTGEMSASFLHGPLLIFHEAGHVIFRVLGEFMMVLGGTLAQLLMPLIIAAALLLKNRDPFGAAIATWLVGVSLLDAAPYIYDALAPQLILLGGQTGEQGGHDWIYILGELGWLEHSHALGWMTHKLGAAVVIASLGWAAWLLWEQRKHVSEHGVLTSSDR